MSLCLASFCKSCWHVCSARDWLRFLIIIGKNCSHKGLTILCPLEENQNPFYKSEQAFMQMIAISADFSTNVVPPLLLCLSYYLRNE